MAGAGEAWQGRMLPAQASSRNDSSSYFLLRKTQRTDRLSSISALTLGESWTLKLPLTYQSLVGYKDDEEICVKEPEQFSIPKREGQSRMQSESWEEITSRVICILLGQKGLTWEANFKVPG